MPIEFLVFINLATFPSSQELPTLFFDSCFHGYKFAYLTSNRRYRFKVKLVVSKTGKIKIGGDRWVQFCIENMENARLMHFVEQGDDTFYVTGYDNDGLECGGYNIFKKRPARIMTRVWLYQDYPQMLPIDFLSGLDENSPISITANNISYDVRAQLVEIEDEAGVFKYELNGDDWNALVEGVGLDLGMLVVFTKKELNSLGLMAFEFDSGNPATTTNFDGVTNLKKRQRTLSLEEEADERMEHICLWPGHKEHFGEKDDTFYRRFSSTLDRQRLAISAKLMEKHSMMHLYCKALIRHQDIEFEMKMNMDRHSENRARTNHVNIFGKWREFGRACGFDRNKMMRVKYVHTVVLLEGDNRERIPVFNVC